MVSQLLEKKLIVLVSFHVLPVNIVLGRLLNKTNAF